MNFTESLREGKVGESVIANFFKSLGWYVLPVYEIEKSNGKGPQLFGLNSEYVAPDAIIFKGENTLWIEAKHKTAFAWYRKKKIWTTGIDKRHFLHYCHVDSISPFDVWIMFLHKGGEAKDSPPSESGLFVQKLSILKECIDHENSKFGSDGMVFWDKKSLIKRANYNTNTGMIE